MVIIVGADEGIAAKIKSVFQGGRTVGFFWDSVYTFIIASSAVVGLLFAWNHFSDVDLYTEKKLPVFDFHDILFRLDS